MTTTHPPKPLEWTRDGIQARVLATVTAPSPALCTFTVVTWEKNLTPKTAKWMKQLSALRGGGMPGGRALPGAQARLTQQFQVGDGDSALLVAPLPDEPVGVHPGQAVHRDHLRGKESQE